MTTIPHPDFTAPQFSAAPDARFVPAPADGVLPEDFFSTTNLPTYVRVAGQWTLPREPRMDSALVLDREGVLWVREMRRVRAGDLVAVGKKEDGTQGIFVNTEIAGTDDDGDALQLALERVPARREDGVPRRTALGARGSGDGAGEERDARD